MRHRPSQVAWHGLPIETDGSATLTNQRIGWMDVNSPSERLSEAAFAAVGFLFDAIWQITGLGFHAAEMRDILLVQIRRVGCSSVAMALRD